jgi:hypothetical protein
MLSEAGIHHALEVDGARGPLQQVAPIDVFSPVGGRLMGGRIATSRSPAP